MRFKIKPYSGIAICFIIIIAAGFIYSITHKDIFNNITKKDFISFKSEFEESYNKLFLKDYMIDTFGQIHDILGKREMKDYEVMKDNEKNLYLGKEVRTLNKDNVEKSLNSIREIYNKTQEIGSKFLFVQVPYKTHDRIKELEHYPQNYRNKEYDLLLKKLEEEQIPFLDLRNFEEARETYKTDHHWTVEASFFATRVLMDRLETLYNIKIINEAELKNLSNYDLKTYQNSFLGSIGVKAGEKFSKKEDFNVLVPKFETDLEYKHIINNEIKKQTKGDFWQTFINEKILDDPHYKNKYNACLQAGYVENIIKNNLATNNLKMLFVAHSYGRPMAQYLSLFFDETRYLDPSKGRYNENYLNYIENYQPDIVVVMYNGEINVLD